MHTGKKITQRTAVREICVSRHNGGQVKDPSYAPRCHSDVIFGGFQGGSQLGSHDAERGDFLGQLHARSLQFFPVFPVGAVRSLMTDIYRSKFLYCACKKYRYFVVKFKLNLYFIKKLKEVLLEKSLVAYCELIT